MRDTLTALAGAVILILSAALAAPPLIDWAGQRDLIDRTVSASLGLPARSEGRIEVRLLPSPRLRLDRLRLGGEAPDRPSLDARFVKAEVALAPLLKGEFRFTETRIGRAEFTLPVTESDAVLLPPDLLKTAAARDLVIEDMRVQQFLVTTQVPATGRTDQFLAEGLQVRAPSLAGPWQIEGLSGGGVPFRLASSMIGADGAMTIKVSGGGEGKPRFEADAKVGLKPADPAAAEAGGARAMVPETEGSARLVVGPQPQGGEPRLPFSLSGRFKASGATARFESLNAELDPGGQAVRLAGTGRVDLRNWRASLSLDGRRLNLDALRASSAGQAIFAGALRGDVNLPIMLDLDLKVASMALGSEEWSDVAFDGTFDRAGGLVLKHVSGTAPGAARIDASGEVEIAPNLRFDGRLDLDAADSEGLGHYVRKLGAEGPALALLDGRPFKLASDVDLAGDGATLRNVALTLGEAKLSGNARYTKAHDTTRGRLSAQLDARGVDIAELPPLGGFLPGLERHDVDLKLSARDVRYGPAGAGSGQGRIAASIQSDGASLVVDSLDITDLAGANAKLSGRIAPDGAGRISGHVAAPVAAPLMALLDRVWIAESRLVPRFLREGGLDLDVSLERAAGEADTLRATAKGKAGESTLDGTLLTRGGRIDSLDTTLSAPRAGRWFGRDDIAGLRQPGRLVLSAKSATAGAAAGPDAARLDLTVNGSVAGLTLSTVQPLALGAEPGPPEAGKLHLETTDLTPFLTLMGGAVLPSPLPADLTLTLSRKDEDAHAEAVGRIADANASASLDRSPEGALTGKTGLTRLSLPALTAALVLPTEPKAVTDARFVPVPAHPRADLSMSVEALDLGRGLTAKGAAFELSLDGETLTLRNLSGALAGGRIAGSATLTRQGETASISGEGTLSDAGFADLVAGGPIRGRLSASLRYSTSGETQAALASNLGGTGEMTFTYLRVPGADPGAIGRALTRALGEDDPLREGRVPAILSEEFAAGPLAAKGPTTVSATLVGGTVRSGPVALDVAVGAAPGSERGRWVGTIALDLVRQRLDARGTVTAGAAPKGWTGAKPSVQLGFAGPVSAPQRVLDAGPLTNGLAALVLQRELEKIELSDADQAERQRRRARIEMDKARAAALKAEADRIAAEKAAAEKAAAEKAEADRIAKEKAAAERAARLRAQQAAAEEQARQERDRREAEDAARRARIEAERRRLPEVDPPGGNRPQQP